MPESIELARLQYQGDNMRKVIVSLFPLITLSVATLSSAKTTKVDICHLDDEGKLKPISISERALSAHLKNGSQIIGETVDENCELLPQEKELCIQGDFPGYPSELYQVTLDLSNGLFSGVPYEASGFYYSPGSVEGHFTGSIDELGTTFYMSVNQYYAPWEAVGISTGSSDRYEGNWSAPWGYGAATYTIVGDQCSAFTAGL